MLWKKLQQLVVLLFAIFLGFYGAYNLLEWYSTGEHWANFRSRGDPNNYTRITFADHPLNLASLIAIDAAFVAGACWAGIVLIRLVRSMFQGVTDKTQ
ncbi:MULTISPECIES: hypothetical protein [unclassified Bradyrhizobium]|uniref:hypothetical protein n=1 Tax=unclassified Bradyrhizobium TaxID=2631580 RepID=UPI0028ED4297|nr:MULTISPECIES: hypothetical protein [unclassified Bradyrhizobium]